MVDIILAEIYMNDITGLDIARFAKENSPNTKVILLTGNDTIGEAFDAVLDDCEMYLVKPISNFDIFHFVGMLAEQMGLTVPKRKTEADILREYTEAEYRKKRDRKRNKLG